MDFYYKHGLATRRTKEVKKVNNLILKSCRAIALDAASKTLTLEYTVRHDTSVSVGRDIDCTLHFSNSVADFKADAQNVLAHLSLPRVSANTDITGTIKVSVQKWFEKFPVHFSLKVARHEGESALADNEIRFSVLELPSPLTTATIPASTYNDMIISSVVLGKQAVEQGDALPVTIRFLNAGTERVRRVRVVVKLGETIIYQATGWDTRAGQWGTISFSSLIPASMPAGSYGLTVELDPDDVLKDRDRSNNTVSTTINIEVSGNDGDEFSSEYGYGLIDVRRAVEMALELKKQPAPASNLKPIEFKLEDIPNDDVEIGILNISEVPPVNDIKLDATNAAEVQAHGLKGEGIIVAIVDTGVFSDHPDLKDNIWRDAQGRPGINFADDDYDTSDRIGHGTHVAGIVGAVQNNNRVTGVAPNVKLMPVKVLGGKTIGTSWDIAQGIKYAVDNGARVINISLGGHFPMQSIEKAIEYAASRNVIVVSAAGNSAGTTPVYPAAYASKYGIAVGAINPNLIRAGFSNRAGNDPNIVYVVAPGTNINSTTRNGRFGGMTGTSMAAPVVAGCVALMLNANPSLTHEQVRQIIKETAAHY